MGSYPQRFTVILLRRQEMPFVLTLSAFYDNIESICPRAQEVDTSKAPRALLLQRVCRGTLQNNLDRFPAQEIQKYFLHTDI